MALHVANIHYYVSQIYLTSNCPSHNNYLYSFFSLWLLLPMWYVHPTAMKTKMLRALLQSTVKNSSVGGVEFKKALFSYFI